MNFSPNPLFFEISKIFAENYTPENKVVICNEGGSRSSKTWDAFHFIVAYCDHNRNKNNTIYILRDTLTNCRDFTLKEFQDCLKVMGIWDQDNFRSHPKPDYNLFGNQVFFRGLDDEANVEGYPSDILFINEALETEKSKVAGLRMRCRKLLMMDWNPKYTQHWCFDLEGQPNTFFTHTTYTNNRHLQKSVRAEIESYSPWVIEDMHLPKEKRRPHIENIKNNTVDEFRWMVYGMGIRSAPEGVIFTNVIYIDKFPDLAYVFGADFGFTTDPFTLVKYAEDTLNIYLELLCFHPIETPEEIDLFLTEIKMWKGDVITADSSDKYVSEKKGAVEMVSALKKLGWFGISKVRKTKNVMFWLSSMKKKRIHIVKNHLVHHARKEAENYRLKIINGIAINQPEDKFNHFWDGARYAHMSMNEKTDSTNWEVDWN